MIDISDLDARYERIGGFVCYVRKPRLLMSGNVAEFFVDGKSPDADAVLALGASKYQDCECYVTVHLVKDANGASLAKAAPEPAEDTGKPYGKAASELYRHGFFYAPEVKAAIGVETYNDQRHTARALAAILGFESMGMVPPHVLRDWCELEGCAAALPPLYRA